MIGRTHGVHAEPMTLGVKLALWYAELQRDLDRVLRARDVVSVGKISGAVGTFAHLDPGIEARVCERLGLAAGAGVVAGHSARSPRRAAVDAGHHGGLAREVRARDPRAAEDRDRRDRRAVRQGPEGLLGDAAQAQPDRLRADHRPRAADARQRPWPRSRTWRCGTSATSRIRRSSASSCPTASSRSTTCCAASLASSAGWWCTPSG